MIIYIQNLHTVLVFVVLLWSYVEHGFWKTMETDILRRKKTISQCLSGCRQDMPYHNNDVIMGAIASQITSLTIVYSIVYSDADQRKHQSSASLAFVWGFHRGPMNSPHKWPVTRKMFPIDDVIMIK